MRLALKVGPVDWTHKVYVIGPAAGPYKIGLARNVLRRFYGIQNGHHQDLFIHWSYEHLKPAEARAIELAAHKTLKDKRLRGEWFNCTLDEAIQAIGRAIDQRVYIARFMSTKDLRGFIPPEDIYKMAARAQESVIGARA
jgi:hypothetical protein